MVSEEVILEYLLALMLLLIPAVLIYFEFKDYKKKKKQKKELSEKSKEYIKRVREIEIKESSTSLDDIDLIAKEFFQELFEIKKFPGYYLLQQEFENEKKNNEALFCKIMNEFLYEKNKPSKKDIQKLKEVLIKIILSNNLSDENKGKEDKNKKFSKKEKDNNNKNKESDKNQE